MAGGAYQVSLFHSTSFLPDKRAALGQKILNKVPSFLKPYTINFINKPIANLTSFLILHELTAVGPLIGIWYLFHKYQISIPLDLPQWAISKGTRIIDDSMQSFNFDGFSLNEKFQLISEGAYAFVVVKMLMPVRVVLSFALTPVFTRFVIEPIQSVFSKKKKEPESPVVDKPTEVKPKRVEKRRL
ncbi:hypothetical protein CANTEDRAFT_113012 [Yamadazyma tenuis ATCC 10573]|nr:uncharacterized protein CANTEDRAFT_113012 [Yamadazyma tenuis ATCC 10573]EGV65486.1 hypothetical protein CANTEDRAFT_113012 [Yamadazyma tenuis ATCC 10573]